MIIRSIIDAVKRKLHVHYFSKIIASRYVSFNVREVVVECRCGNRDIRIMHHDWIYPFPTNTGITSREMQNLLKAKQ